MIKLELSHAASCVSPSPLRFIHVCMGICPAEVSELMRYDEDESEQPTGAPSNNSSKKED